VQAVEVDLRLVLLTCVEQEEEAEVLQASAQLEQVAARKAQVEHPPFPMAEAEANTMEATPCQHPTSLQLEAALAITEALREAILEGR